MRSVDESARGTGTGGARLALGLIASALLAGCAATGSGGDSHWPAALDANGPQADYPVVIGEPYAVAGVTFTPQDVLNYDEVGFAVADAEGGEGISAAHHTLPLPSYVEVTSLESGRTALIRVERRGPMDDIALVALSPGAAAQLEAAPGTPVRVRRVNPPEDQRALLRAGEAAPLRMDTPMSLVEVLRRKLPGAGAAQVAQGAPDPMPTPAEEAAPASRIADTATAIDSEFDTVFADAAPIDLAEPMPPMPAAPSASDAAEDAAPAVLTEAEASPWIAIADVVDAFDTAFANGAPIAANEEPAPVQPSASDAAGRFMVQAAAFSTAERARRAADALAGSVSPSGAFFRVRTGPFATRAEAEAALAKVRDAGYSDARIFTSG